MSHRLPKRWILATLLIAAGAIAVFVVLNDAFGGPQPSSTGGGFTISLVADDVQGLVQKSLVMVRGVQVGDVASVAGDGDAVRVQLAIDRTMTPIYRNATVQIGHRTLFGEAYVDLSPGTASSGVLRSGATLARGQVLPTVDLDQALEALGPATRRHLESIAGTGGTVGDSPDAGSRLNATLGSLAATISGLRALGRELAGQQTEVSSLIEAGHATVQELSDRTAEVQSLVTAGDRTLTAVISDPTALGNGLRQLSLLLSSTRRTLTTIRPLLVRASPVLATLAAAAPEASDALRALPPAARSAQAVLAALPAATQAAVPTFKVLTAAGPVVNAMIAPVSLALRDIVPIADYLEPYGTSIVGFIAGGSAVRIIRANGTATPTTLADAAIKPFDQFGVDGAPYGWARFFVDSNLGTVIGSGAGIGSNPYPKPGDPYDSWLGRYPRLEPVREPSK